MAEYLLDDLDRSILHELEQDGRRAFREIARNVGTSEATVRTRVKRLQEHNILRIVAFADPQQLSQSQLCLTLIKVQPAHFDKAVEALSAMPEVTYVSTVMGRADLCVEVMCRDNNELWDFLRRKVETIPGVSDTESMMILKVHKLRYGAPVAG
ncbi:Lrp/AsnC family transcriptional regulator [Specibacter cremeus]|uniref:Lrp/AsnC family transcriptional regulator n=1 Tax=Specibacter cremeus TaxID=1629051 RepID=UPI000F78195D|nr:Lrp/AsnC family transcriptional regulator [Specibacter cremeus]